MAGDWIKMRTGIEQTIPVFRIMQETGLSRDSIICALYRLACWFNTYGKYGKIKAHFKSVVGSAVDIPGLEVVLENVGWLRESNGWLMLGGFCDMNMRKSLGTSVRAEVLACGKCEACGSAESLTVDHMVPICRGGTGHRSNLQCLCKSCNVRKGRKTMTEFMRLLEKEAAV